MLKSYVSIDPKFHFEHHFNYPPDGNHHHSVKLISTNLEYYIGVFYDHIRYKKIENGMVTRKEMKRRTVNANLGLDHQVFKVLEVLDEFVHIYKLPPFASLNKQLEFITKFMLIVNGQMILSSAMSSTEYITTTDEIGIDLANYKTTKMTIGTCIQPKGLPRPYEGIKGLTSVEKKITDNLDLVLYTFIEEITPPKNQPNQLF